MSKQKFYLKGNRRFSLGAFTLIELLVALAIFGLLVSVVFVSLKGAKDKARIANILQYSSTVKKVLGADIVGEWRFNEGTGTSVADSSGYNNNGAIFGAAWVDSIPELGKALSFDGTNDYVDSGNNASLNITGAITIEAWFNPNTWYAGATGKQIANKYFYSGGGTTQKGWWLGRDYSQSNFIRFAVYKEGAVSARVDSNTSIEARLGQWTHVVGVFTPGDSVKLYINGVLDRSVNTSLLDFTLASPNTIIGRRSDNSTQGFFDGFLDEVRIYSRALSTAEIQQHYAEGAKKRGLAAND